MTHNENHKNESQDARRKDEHNTVHPDEARKNSSELNKNKDKSCDNKNKPNK